MTMNKIVEYSIAVLLGAAKCCYAQQEARAYQPSSAARQDEEIWIATEGDVNLLIGRRLRTLSAGSAYRVPSTGLAAQSRINLSGKTTKFLYMVK